MQLINLSATNKIRVVDINLLENEDGTYTITRLTGQLNGKMTVQPSINIEKGKVKRTIKEQADLEFNSNVKKYKDKGYKEIKGDVSQYKEEDLRKILPEVASNSDGNIKPQLAKQADKVASKKTFDKQYYGSRKVDGLRVLIRMDGGELKTSSRGATNYDAAMYEILSNPTLIQIFKENPGLVMDGECYKHGMSLQDINSIARTQKKAVDYEVLQFYWFDVVQLDKPFSERFAFMKSIADKYNITFEPERTFKEGELRIQLIPQVPISGWDNMLKLHNDYVAEGWEGLVIKLASSVYGPNKRTNDWIKIKMYKDDEFKIVGYQLGLRGNEDMCFKCVTEEGKEFLAKPWGDREQKDWYVDNFESECLGKMAVVKYFYMSDDNVPLQPSVKCIRLEGDI